MNINIIERIININLDKVVDVDEEVGPNDHIVGTLSETSKRLHGLCEEARKKVVEIKKTTTEQLTVKHKAHQVAHIRGTNAPDCCDLNNKEVQQLRKKMGTPVAELEAITKIFWEVIKLEFPELLDKREIGIRRNFTVVWVEDDSGVFTENTVRFQ
jgi:hypothetical protein